MDNTNDWPHRPNRSKNAMTILNKRGRDKLSNTEETANRIFNLLVNVLCDIKGYEFFTEEEYRRFDEKGKNVIRHELNFHRPTSNVK